jgi:hypothetical protein
MQPTLTSPTGFATPGFADRRLCMTVAGCRAPMQSA